MKKFFFYTAITLGLVLGLGGCKASDCDCPSFSSVESDHEQLSS